MGRKIIIMALCAMMIAGSPAYADGVNGDTIEATAALTVRNSVFCTVNGCLTSDNEKVEPVEVVTDGSTEKVYVY